MLNATVGLLITLAVLNPHAYVDLRNAQHHLTVPLSAVIANWLFILFWQYLFDAFTKNDRFALLPRRAWTLFKGMCAVTAYANASEYVRFRHFPTVRRSLVLLGLLLLYELAREHVTNVVVNHFASRDPRRAIILGSGRQAGKAWRAARTYYHSSIALLGFIDDRDPAEMPPDIANRFLGNIDTLSETLLRRIVDVVIIAMPVQSCYALMQRGVAAAESAGVEVVYLDDIYSSRRSRSSQSPEMFLREFEPKQHNHLVRLVAKRALDVFGSVIGLVLLSPLLIGIGLIVKLTSTGPAIYRQERHGLRRRSFTMLKFRSMVESADLLLPELEAVNEASGPIFKMKEDPRVTGFGRFLRTTSLDELPQLWNVLKGEMSLVGPRPMSVRDVSRFDEASLMRRFCVKPGMTGLWQISGRSNVSFDTWIAMDNVYIDNWSLRMDLQILAKTAQAVLGRSGAM